MPTANVFDCLNYEIGIMKKKVREVKKREERGKCPSGECFQRMSLPNVFDCFNYEVGTTQFQLQSRNYEIGITK